MIVRQSRPSMRLPVLLLLAAAPLLAQAAAPTARADDVSAAIQQAGKTYEAGQLRETLKQLGVAVSALQARLAEMLAAFLPGEVEGWTRGEPTRSEFASSPEGLVVFGNLFSAGVQYARAEGEGEIVVTLTNQQELTGIARASLEMLENPFFKEMATEDEARTGEKVEAVTLQELRGLRRWNAEKKEGEITLFAGDVLIQAEGSDLRDTAELEAVLRTANLAGLARFAAPAP